MNNTTVKDDIFWINFAEELSKIREKERQKLPYNFNLIDELHANENAHTRILLKLLNYNISGEYTILKSFLFMICEHNPNLTFPITSIHKPSVDFNKENIDGLIEEPSKDYAIIIENKINWATDQELQLVRYFNTVKQHGIQDRNIFVIYLTLDGSKKVSSNSLPNSLSDELKNGNRFIEMNYRDDILPWLKYTILPEIKIKEHLIESGIRQYIDYLEGRLCLRKSEEPIKIIMNKTINEKLLQGKTTCEQWQILNNCTKNLENLLQDFRNVSEEITKPVIDSWDTSTKNSFNDTQTNNQIQENNGYYQIFLNGIDRNIHFEWYTLSKNDLFNKSHYRMVLHVEGDTTDKLNMLKLARIDELRNTAEKYEFFLPFDERRGAVDAIFKEYSTPNNIPFAALDESNRTKFLKNCYEEIKTLKGIIERTFHKFDDENKIINELCRSLQEFTDYQWRYWPENNNCGWDIVTDFNKDTHRIGIEGSFAVNADGKIEFRSYITVWRSQDWDIYEENLKEKYPNLSQFIEKKGDRADLPLPTIIIGDDLTFWSEKKECVVNHLKETFEYMKQLTSEIGR